GPALRCLRYRLVHSQGTSLSRVELTPPFPVGRGRGEGPRSGKRPSPLAVSRLRVSRPKYMMLPNISSKLHTRHCAARSRTGCRTPTPLALASRPRSAHEHRPETPPPSGGARRRPRPDHTT